MNYFWVLDPDMSWIRIHGVAGSGDPNFENGSESRCTKKASIFLILQKFIKKSLKGNFSPFFSCYKTTINS